MADDSRISPYNLADCKNTTDDALQNYLNGLKIQQSHYYTDVKLALGFTAVILSGACFAWDYKLGWDATKYWTAAAVAVYFILNGAFTFWMWYVEKGVVYTGNWKRQQIVISTTANKNDPIYRLSARITSSAQGDSSKEIRVDAPFMKWFTADGYFVAQPFQQWLASSVPLFGEIDPKSKAGATARGGVPEATTQTGSVSAALDGLVADASTAGGSKRRKG